jgi:hypothetical protein
VARIRTALRAKHSFDRKLDLAVTARAAVTRSYEAPLFVSSSQWSSSRMLPVAIATHVSAAP